MTRTAKVMTLRLGLLFTVTGIIVLAIRLLGRPGRLAPGVALAIGIALLVVGLVFLFVRVRAGSNKSKPPDSTT